MPQLPWPSTTAAADALIPAGHPFAAHLLRAAAAGEHRPWTPDDGPLPSLYLSHGAPTLFEMTAWMTQLTAGPGRCRSRGRSSSSRRTGSRRR